MKRISIVLMAILLMLTPLTAMAKVTSTDLLIDNEGSGQEGMLPYVESVFVYNGKLYVMCNGIQPSVYEWLPETGDMKQFAVTINGSSYILADSEKLYQFDRWGGMLYNVTFAEDKMTIVDALPFDSEIIMREEGDHSYAKQTYSCFVRDGMLYLLIDGSDPNNYDVRDLVRVDLATGKGETLLSGVGIQDVCMYKENSLLCLVFDNQKYYETYDYATSKADDSLLPKIQVFNIDSQTFGDTLFTLPITQGNGLAYDEANDIIYFTTTEGLFRLTAQNTAPELVNYIASSLSNGDMQACLIGSDYYALVDYSGLYIRSTNPDDKPATILNINGTSFEWEGRQGYMAFKDKHPETAVVSRTDMWFRSAQEIFTDMMTDTAADIYTVSDIGMMETLIKKGYAMDLSVSQVLIDAIEKMYPHLTAPFYSDGKLYAIPFSVNDSGLLAYSPSVLKQIGLTENDLPTTISELIDFIVDWVDIYSMENQQLDLFQNQYDTMRNMVLSMIFSQQIAYCAKNDIPLTFDTPEMAELLNKLDSVSSIISELDLTQEERDGGFSWSSDDKMTALFTQNYSIFSGHWGDYYDYTPLSISLKEGVPKLDLVYMQLLFVNPRSQNAELAVALFESLLTNLAGETRIRLYPDQNDPVQSAYYEQNMKAYQESLTVLQQSIANETDEEQKKMYEEQQASMDDWLKSIESSRYEISSESIAMYRNLAENMILAGNMYSAFFASEDLATLLQRYLEQQMTGQQFIKETQKVLKKIYLEGN